MSRPTVSEEHAYLEKRRAAYEQRVQVELAQANQVIAEATGLRKLMLETHRPHLVVCPPGQPGSNYLECRGCEWAGPAEHEPYFPCRSWKISLGWQE